MTTKTNTQKPPNLGCVNAVRGTKMLNQNWEVVGHCFDTPNAAAYAFNKMPDVIFIKSSIAQFGKSTGDEYNQLGTTYLGKNRIKCAGWFDNDEQAGFLLLNK